MTPLAEGLRISITGLVLVFAALGLLILLLVILQRVSNWLLASEARVSARAQAGADADARHGGELDQRELARVAAIAVALVMARASTARDPSLGTLLQQPASEWWRPSRTRTFAVKERDAGWPTSRLSN